MGRNNGMETSGLKLMSAAAVSTAYNLSKYTIYGLIKSDPTFPCLNIGPKKNYRIPLDLLNAWIQQRFREKQYQEMSLPSASQLLSIGRN